LECSELFLEQIVATDEQAIHIVIWDKAGFHHTPKAALVAIAPLLPRVESDGETMGHRQGAYWEQSF